MLPCPYGVDPPPDLTVGSVPPAALVLERYPSIILINRVYVSLEGFLLLILFSWSPVRGVCLNHEVVMFQPQILAPPYLGSVMNCYIRYSTLLNPLRPSF